jgi:hypothetical protein
MLITHFSRFSKSFSGIIGLSILLLGPFSHLKRVDGVQVCRVSLLSGLRAKDVRNMPMRALQRRSKQVGCKIGAGAFLLCPFHLFCRYTDRANLKASFHDLFGAGVALRHTDGDGIILNPIM